MRSAQSTGQRLGEFISSVGQQGLEEAARQAGLPDLTGMSANEICLTLLDHLGGSANTVDEVDARNALSATLDEMLEDAETYQDVDELLEGLTGPEALEDLLHKFFSNYLFEQFNRTFYERLVERVGSVQADSFMQGIHEYIRSSIEARAQERDLSSVNWAGPEGEAIAEEILTETFDIYAGDAE